MTHKATGYWPQTMPKVNWEAEYKMLQSENAKLRAAIDMALNAKQHENVKAILRGQLSLNEQLKPEPTWFIGYASTSNP